MTTRMEETVSTECSCCNKGIELIKNLNRCEVCGNFDCDDCLADNSGQCTKCNPPT